MRTPAAEVMRMQKDKENEAFEAAFSEPLFREELLFRIKAKSEDYLGEQRVRYTVVGLQKVDPVADSTHLIRQIAKFT